MKIRKSILALALLMNTFLYSQNSHAVIAVDREDLWDNDLFLAGGIVLLTGVCIDALDTCCCCCSSSAPKSAASIIASLLEAGALVILDQPTSMAGSFPEISKNFASRFGISEDERSSYNHELATINAVHESIKEELGPWSEGKKEAAINAWKAYLGQSILSPKATRCLEKLSMFLTTEFHGIKPQA